MISLDKGALFKITLYLIFYYNYRWRNHKFLSSNLLLLVMVELVKQLYSNVFKIKSSKQLILQQLDTKYTESNSSLILESLYSISGIHLVKKSKENSMISTILIVNVLL